VVPYSFIGTQAIAHPLIDENAELAAGWCARSGSRVGEVVLPGYTAFSVRDARTAAVRLLRFGPVHIKKAFSAGGGSQSRDLAELPMSCESRVAVLQAKRYDAATAERSPYSCGILESRSSKPAP
jgi:hypothetical protein